MTDAVFNPPLGAAQIQFVGAQATTTDTSHVPPGFEKLPTGTLLQGFVINRDAHNNPILRTSMGDVLVKTDVFLKTGSDVVMRVVNTAQHSSARIVSVDGASIQQLQQQQDLQHVQAKQDLVLQSSMANSKTAIVSSSNSTPAAYVEGVLLDATTNAAKPHVMAAILNIPTEDAQAISEGVPVQFRVIASNLNITETVTNRLPATTAEQLTSPAQQATYYQAYSKTTGSNTAMPPLFRPTVESAHPAGIASIPNAVAVPTVAALPVTTPAAIPANLTAHPEATPITTPPIQAASLAANTAPSIASAPPIATAAPTPLPATLLPATPMTASPLASSIPELTTPSALPPSTQPAVAVTTPVAPVQPPDSAAIAQTQVRMEPQTLATPVATGKLVSPQLLAEPELTQTARAIAAENINAMTPINQRPDSQPIPIPAQPLPLTQALTLKTGLINATVIGSEANGGTILRTPIGTIKLFTDNPPPVNSILQLEVAASPSATQAPSLSATNSTAVSIPSTSSLLTDWPSLGALQTLAQNNPDLARELSMRIPNTKSKLVNSALFFISALRAGSIDQWLGRKTTADIERLAPNLLKQLHAELGILQSIAQTDPGQPWQIIPFPLQHDQGMHQLRLYVRQDKPKESAKGEASGTRFVLDLTLSQMGDIQLDGFSRHMGNTLMFDLIFRSVIAIPDAMQLDLSTLFAEAAAAAHFTGTLTFQNNPELFVHPLDDILSAQASGEDSSIIA